MNGLPVIAAVLVAGVAVVGCSTTPTLTMPNLAAPVSGVTTGALPAGNKAAAPVRGTPVVADRPARVFVWAGFKEKDCSPVPATVTVAKQPGKGTVSFRDNQTTTVQYSQSGKCIGQRMQGTGVYYTAGKGKEGVDTFSVTATTPTGQTLSRSFQVRIVD
jgi:hypothetical protein